jgi:hypothetical protein
MSQRFVLVLLAGVVFLAGLALAQEPAGQDEPPVRLKKKKPRGDDKPMTEPAKPDDKKKDDKKAEPREAEPVTPQEEEKEVLQRVIKNVHNVEERLAKNDLGEGTRQTQRDILKDIESLIRHNESASQSGGQPDQDNGGEDQNASQNKDQQGKGGQKSQANSGGGRKSQSNGGSGGGAGRKSQSQRNGGRQTGKQPGGQKSGKSQTGGDKSAGKDGDPKDGDGKKPGGKNGKGGNGGGGGDKDDRARNKSADVYKAEWGHVPATLRPQMDAYSNQQSFLPKYDDLIKRYYRTIAEQGRRKGD